MDVHGFYKRMKLRQSDKCRAEHGEIFALTWSLFIKLQIIEIQYKYSNFVLKSNAVMLV